MEKESKDLDINEEITKLKEEFIKCSEDIELTEEARQGLNYWAKEVAGWIKNPGPSIARGVFPIEKANKEMNDWADNTADHIIQLVKGVEGDPLPSTIALALRAAYSNGFEDAKDRAETICLDEREKDFGDWRTAAFRIRGLTIKETK